MVDHINDIVKLNPHSNFFFVEILTFLLLTGKELVLKAIIVMRKNC